MNKKILIVVTALLAFSLLHPVQVKKKDVRDFQSFEKGTFKGTGLTDSGELFVSPGSTVIKGPEREYYLSVDTSSQGDIYMGTGHNASVFKIGKDGKSVELFKAAEPDIYAILYSSDGYVYAGSSPRGKLYRISGDKKSKEFFNPDEKYIWDLKQDKAGYIICAVGGGGGIYKIDSKGNSRKIFTSVDVHIMSLFISADNSILAGSGGNGILYRIGANKTFVLFDTPFEEVNGISEDREGNVWFTASREVRKGKITTADGKSMSFSYPKGRSSLKEKSALYLRTPGGEVEKIWSSTSEYIYSIVSDKKNGGVLIGTGDRGRIYRVRKDRSFSLIYEGESAQTYKISTQPDGFTIIFNNTSSIVKLDNFSKSRGVYISNVFDLGIQSRVGKLYWESESKNSPSVSLFVRSGNTSSPDSTWTEWSPPYTDSRNSIINRSGFKYFQVKVNLNSTITNKSPKLSGYNFYYIQKNLKPDIKNINIRLPRFSKKNIAAKKTVTEKKGVLDISWSAYDPNRDDLTYSIFLKKYSGSEWMKFRDNITKTKVELNTELYEDGDYILKLVVDDSLSNSPESYRSDSKESKKFTIDSTAPILSNFLKTGELITFDVLDRSSVLSKVQYSFTGERWFPLNPVDMITDSQNESFKLLKKIFRKNKIIFFKVTDEYKNSKVFQKEI